MSVRQVPQGPGYSTLFYQVLPQAPAECGSLGDGLTRREIALPGYFPIGADMQRWTGVANLPPCPHLQYPLPTSPQSIRSPPLRRGRAEGPAGTPRRSAEMNPYPPSPTSHFTEVKKGRMNEG